VTHTDKIKEAFVEVLKLFPEFDAKLSEVFPFSLSKGVTPINMHGDIDHSSILTLEETDTVMKWLINPLSQTKLLLRGSRDGYTAKVFHEKCDNKGSTLCIYKSNLNKVFGGFSYIQWNAAVTGYVQDTTNSCFLFSVTNKTKHILKSQAHSIFNSPSYCSTFGGHDICISDNNTLANYSNFNNGYVADGIADPKTYLAGAYNFTLLEYEVYQITN